jgi:hypothetical protein
MYVTPCLRPCSERSAAGNIGVIGMRIDGQCSPWNFSEDLGHRSALGSLWRRRLVQKADFTPKVVDVLEALVDAGKSQVGDLVDDTQALEHGQANLL